MPTTTAAPPISTSALMMFASELAVARYEEERDALLQSRVESTRALERVILALDEKEAALRQAVDRVGSVESHAGRMEGDLTLAQHRAQALHHQVEELRAQAQDIRQALSDQEQAVEAAAAAAAAAEAREHASLETARALRMRLTRLEHEGELDQVALAETVVGAAAFQAARARDAEAHQRTVRGLLEELAVTRREARLAEDRCAELERERTRLLLESQQQEGGAKPKKRGLFEGWVGGSRGGGTGGTGGTGGRSSAPNPAPTPAAAAAKVGVGTITVLPGGGRVIIIIIISSSSSSMAATP